GAGKTTTMRVLATLLRPTAGEAWVAGHSVLKERRDVRRAIGYMPDFFGVYGDMKVWEYLDFFAACYEIPAGTRSTWYQPSYSCLRARPGDSCRSWWIRACLRSSRATC
ncbi:TPA: ATP-binding cassette domain-containing protein, partial [Candidatus Micrarchaeota archaeon]|nr:ATP-binding cassette domain-containing protein [Candidatus Micrarchaeota archaeon]